MQGGSKTKCQARKFSTSYSSRAAIPMSKDELEVYACVMKLFGQGRCLVKTVDGHEINCIIRNKFKGRSKHNNTLVLGSIILVGLRHWEGEDQKKICDLLYVYDNDEHNVLKTLPNTRIQNLNPILDNLTNSYNNNDSGLIFTDEINNVFEKNILLDNVVEDDIDVNDI
jgi:initiation factor 1A